MNVARDVLTLMYEIEAESLGQYIATMDNSLRLAQADLIVRLDAMTKGLPEADVENIVQRAEGDAFFLHRHAPAIMWQSVFTVIYSFFEQKLDEFAQEVHIELAQTKASEPVLRLNFWNLDETVKFLKSKKKFPSQSKAWSEITRYSQIRNQIAHRGGRLTVADWLKSRAYLQETDEKRKEAVEEEVKKSRVIVSYIESRARAKKPGIEIEGCTVVLDRTFCDEALDTIKAFFDELTSLMQ